ncbi:MAG TPA: polysaccharide deacetylase family protein [Chitinophagaceae bacterium]|nr:polysaccharide deacetylase family protein [Chitinophagaceae bacterium]
MTVSLFKKIIGHLVQNYQVVPLEHYLDDPGAFQTRKKLATVLFDDGYKDNIEYAAPVLGEYKCPASFYIVTDCIDKNRPTWTYLIDNALAKTQKNKLEFSFDFVPPSFRFVDIRLNSRPNPLLKELKPWMKKLSNPQRLAITDAIIHQCDDVQIPQNMMNWNDIKQLMAGGFIVGSHSHTHPLLASMQSETEILNELQPSAQRISKETGKFPSTISYPIGSYDNRVIELAIRAGYKYGLAVGQQFYTQGKDDVFRIPRVELYQEPWWKVKMRVSGVYSKLKKLWP